MAGTAPVAAGGFGLRRGPPDEVLASLFPPPTTLPPFGARRFGGPRTTSTSLRTHTITVHSLVNSGSRGPDGRFGVSPLWALSAASYLVSGRWPRLEMLALHRLPARP